MTPDEKEVFQRANARDWVVAAIDAGLFTLLNDSSLNALVSGIDLIHGVPSLGPAPRVRAPDLATVVSMIRDRVEPVMKAAEVRHAA